METVLEVDPLTEFFESIRSPLTKDRYEHRFDLFLIQRQIEGKDLRERAKAFAMKAKQDQAWATFQINEYMRFQRGRAEKREISNSTLPNFWKPVKLFCDMNDIALNWKKITRKLPTGRNYANDRAPNRKEISKLLEYDDDRIKPIVLTMVSSGIRLGAWDYLKWGDIEPIEKPAGHVIAARLKVYSGTKDEYVTFITAEAYKSLKDWMNSREQAGEKIDRESWLMRNLWDAHAIQRGSVQQRGTITEIKQLSATGIARLIQRALYKQRLRKKLAPGKRRHEFQADHGFRKYFDTVCDKHMKTLYVEFLMGHNTGLKESYNRADESELLENYLKAVPELTFYERIQGATTEDIESLKARLNLYEQQLHEQSELGEYLLAAWAIETGLSRSNEDKEEIERLTKLRGKLFKNPKFRKILDMTDLKDLDAEFIQRKYSEAEEKKA
jgi:hypothetical protein